MNYIISRVVYIQICYFCIMVRKVNGWLLIKYVMDVMGEVLMRVCEVNGYCCRELKEMGIYI